MQMMDTLRYELPVGGTTLLGYIVRRMHKTAWLLPIKQLLQSGDTAQALGRVAMYALTASTSFGRAHYQPEFDSPGDEVQQADPATGALVTARLDAREPQYRISYEVTMPDGGRFTGKEQINGTTVGLRGLGMPAPSQFHFEIDGYSATLIGVLTSELALSLIGRTRIRAHGSLDASDGAGNKGSVRVDRAGNIELRINGQELNLALPAARETG